MILIFENMKEAILITILIVAISSLMLNVYQWAERRAEKKEYKKTVRDAAVLEEKHRELTNIYNNEKSHREWAIGRIKDQQAVIDQLKRNKDTKRKGGGHV